MIDPADETGRELVQDSCLTCSEDRVVLDESRIRSTVSLSLNHPLDVKTTVFECLPHDHVKSDPTRLRKVSKMVI